MLRLIPLEERIVLDAAMMVQAADDTPDDEGEGLVADDQTDAAQAQDDDDAAPIAIMGALALLDASDTPDGAAWMLDGLQYREGDGYRALIDAPELPVLEGGSAVWAEVMLENAGEGDVLVAPALGPESGFILTRPEPGMFRFTVSDSLLLENTPAEAEELLRNTVALVRYANVSQDPVEGVRTITFTLGNSQEQDTVSRPLLLTSFNDAPVFTDLSPANLVFGEPADPAERSPLPLFSAGSLTITDADSTQLSGASVWISDSVAAPEDGLGTYDRLLIDLPDDAGISATLRFTPGPDGTIGELRLTLEGVADLDTYTRVLETVRYDNLDTDPRQYSRIVRISVTDFDDDGVREDTTSASLEKRITIEATNTPPVVRVNDVAFNESIHRTGYVPLLPALSLTDPDSNNRLTHVVVTLDNPDGVVSDRFNTFEGASSLFTVTRLTEGSRDSFTVRPTALSGVASVGEFQTFLSSWTYSNVSRANTDHQIAITVSAHDPEGAVGVATSTLTVVAKPDAPTSANLPMAVDPDRLAVDEDGRLGLPAGMFPFADIDGDAFAGITITALPTNGSLLLNDVDVQAGQFVSTGELAQLEYIPRPDFNGLDGFDFRVWDDSGAGDSAGLSSPAYSAVITVQPVDDVPVSADLPLQSDPDRLTVDEDDRLPLPADVFPFTDADGDTLAGLTITALPEHGALLLDGTPVEVGQFIPTAALAGLAYVPLPDYNGPDGFGFRAWDDSGENGGPGLSSAEHRAAITVLPVSDAPTSADLPSASEPTRLTVNEDGRLPLPAGVFPFYDPDGDALAGISIIALPEHGSLLLNGVAVEAGQFIPAAALAGLAYVPLPDYNGPDGFGFRAWDNSGENGGPGLSSAEHRATITVLPVADTPNSADLPSASEPGWLTVDEDGRLPLPAEVFPFNDADGDALAGIGIIALPEHGRLLLNGAPVEVGQFIPTAALAGLAYVPLPDYHGPDSFGFRAWDDSGENGGPGLSSAEHRAAITVRPVSDAPTSADLPSASEPTRLTVDEDGRLPLPAEVFPFNDADGDALAGVSIVALPEHGSLLLNGEPVAAGQFIPANALSGLVYVPLADYSGPDGFRFKVWDNSGEGNGRGLSSTDHTALITVRPVDALEPFVFGGRDEQSVPSDPLPGKIGPLEYLSGFSYEAVDYERLIEPFTYPEVDGFAGQEKAFAQNDADDVCTLHGLLGIGCRLVPALSTPEYIAEAGRGALAYASPATPGVPPEALNWEGSFEQDTGDRAWGFAEPLAEAFAHTLADTEFEGVEPGEVDVPAEGLLIVPAPAQAEGGVTQ